MVMLIIGTQQPDADAEFKVQAAGYRGGIAVTDTRSDIEFALVAVRFPLKVVFAASGVQAQKVSGKCATGSAVAQPVTSFETARKDLQAVLVMVDKPPGKQPFRIQ